ncbi:MAG: carbohydrate ABC transporter permease [Alkalispirochaeta sp.]
MTNRTNAHQSVGSRLQQAVIIVGALVVVLPFVWMVGISFSSSGEVLNRFLYVLPTSFSLEGYHEVFDLTPYARWFRNSVVVTTLLTTGQLVTGVLAAYAFARWRFPGREVLFFLVLCTMMIPPQAVMLPLFMVINRFEWINTYRGLIIPHLAHGYVIFMMRQFFLQVPRELDEASQIDGCSGVATLWHVYLSAARPALISVGLIQLVRNWNEYYWTLVVITEQIRLTLPVAIVSFRDETMVRWVPTMSSAAMSVLPIIVLYLVAQRFFHDSNLASGTK